MDHNLTAYERLLDRLRADGKQVKQDRPTHALAQCPGHPDKSPSLSITAIEGQVLMHCFAGCEPGQILDAIGWTARDMFDDPKGVDYRYDDGRIVHRSPDKRFRQSANGSKPSLYRLSKIKAAREAGKTIWLVPGEKDVHTIESLGEVATTGPQGEGNIHLVDLTPLHQAQVIAIADRDAAGLKWAWFVKGALGDRAASLDFMLAAVGKDVSDHVAAGKT